MFLVARLICVEIYVEITRGHGHARKTAAALSHMLPTVDSYHLGEGSFRGRSQVHRLPLAQFSI